MQVKDVMTPDVECVKPNDKLAYAAERMRDLNVGSLPICGYDDRLAGMITDRDITVRATASGFNPADTIVADVMTPDISFCFEDEDISHAAEIMEQRQIRRLVVLNQNKRMVGIVSLGDLAVETGDKELVGTALEGISEPNRPDR